MSRIAIIPAYEPPEAFVAYARALSQTADHLIVVNDGSDRRFLPVFRAIEAFPNTTVLSYEENHGKGYALKRAFSYCAAHFCAGDILVTADCDGQHDLADVMAVCDAAEAHPDACVLGVRDFDHPNVPPRSKAGNTQMLRLLRRLYGIEISDSQTGLRAFTVRTAQAFLQVRGDRFEYETGTLIYAKRNGIPLRQVPIQTIYPEDPEDHVSHFQTFRDSCRVIGIMLRFLPVRSQADGPRFYGSFGRFARWLLRTFSRRYEACVTRREEPVVYVCRHLNMHGPFSTLKWLPFHVHPMIIHIYFDRKKTVRHMTEFTFSARYGKKAKKFSLAAHVMSWISPPLMRSLQGIPVYRSGPQSVTTLKCGRKHLLNGESLIVYPDVDYTGSYSQVSQIYDGFLYLGELYRKKTGKELAFVPLRIDDENRRITEGAPVYVTDFRKEGPAAAERLKWAINWKEPEVSPKL